MHYDNGFELLIAVVFNMSPQLWIIGSKAQDLVIPFCLGEGEYLPDFLLRAICNHKWTSIDERSNRIDQQPYRKIYHGTAKAETSPTLHEFLWYILYNIWTSATEW